MKTPSLKLLFALLATPHVCSAISVISPVGGNSSNGYEPFLSGPIRYQQVYSASDFQVSIPSGGLITQMALKPASDPFGVVDITNVDIRFSITSVSPSSLSPVFGDNVGIDETTVISEPLHFYGAPGDGFTVVFPFQTPFSYDPSRGNLLVDVRSSGAACFIISCTRLGLLADFRPNNSVSEVDSRGSSDPLNTPSGVVFRNLGLVTEFTITPVPEPSALSIAGLAAIAAACSGLVRAERNRRMKIDESR